MDILKVLAAYAWMAVIAIALLLSNWSLAVVGHRFGLPYLEPLPLAWLLSIPFDGAAIVAGDLTLRYARELGSNGSAPKMVVVILAALSAWLNSEHASLLHLGLPAHVMYSTPPIVAVVLFELATRFEYRAALRDAGRTVEPLPTFGAGVYLWHAVGAAKAVAAITGARLETRSQTAITALQTSAQIDQATMTAAAAAHDERLALTGARKDEAIAAAFRELGLSAKLDDVLTWLRDRGVSVHSSYVSKVRSLMLSQPLSGADIPELLPSESAPVTPIPVESESVHIDSPPVIAGQSVNGREPVGSVTGLLPSPAEPGDVVTLGCGHQVTAERYLRFGDEHPCLIHGRNVVWLGNARLDDIIADSKVG